jgi:hypothetical protein
LKQLTEDVPKDDPLAKTEEFKGAVQVLEDTKPQLAWE